MKLSRGVAASILAAALSLAPVLAHAATITVFAAASLTDALNAAGKAYQTKTGDSVVFSFAASSALARQIEASGGADIFLSADTDWMDYLDKKGLIAPGTRRNLFGNHLVLIAPAGDKTALIIAAHFDLLSALRGGRLAVADPASVPAGKYAKAALTALGVWDSVAGHLAQAENVRVALTYVAHGDAPLGIVYATDAAADKGVRVVGTFADNSHPAIVYPAALTKDAKPEAKAFLDYLRTKDALAIFARYGFVITPP